jgi:hypothetical protein
MRAQCFKQYVACVLEADYWAIAHDLDCALTLVGCAGGYVFGGGRTAADASVSGGDHAQRAEQARVALERHSKDLQSVNERIREIGPDAATDKKLEKELERLVGKVERESGR